MFRFLALTNLADAVSKGVDAKMLRSWFKAMLNPGMGKWLHLVKSTQRWLEEERGGSFLVELQERLAGASLAPGPDPGCPWSDCSNRIVEIRNRYAHDRVVVTKHEAKPLLEELETPLSEVLRGVAFLRDYRLGQATWCRKTKDGYSYQWYGSRGLEERCPPVQVDGSESVFEDTMLLVDLRRNRGLYLAPFLHYAPTPDMLEPAAPPRARRPEEARRRVLWIQALLDDDAAPVRYHHPLLAYERRQGFSSACEPDEESPGLSLNAFLERLGSYPQVIELGLDERSRSRLIAPLARADFGERYEIIGALGRGGMGEVFHVRDVELGVVRAIKRMKADLAADERALRRFRREARALAKVDHHRVVRIHDIGMSREGRPFLVMDFIEGEDLQQRLDREGPFPVDQAVELVEQALEALEVIHDAEAGLVHRDVKPANFVLSETGLKAIDFGIVLVRGATSFTVSHDVMGTPGYMAPEQAAGNADRRSDLFSAGRLLFALLAGRPPASAKERLSEVAPAVSEALEAFYRKATHDSSADRFGTAEEMRLALGQARPDPAGSP